MPELPEVETVVRTLRKRVTGLVIEQVRINRSDIVRAGRSELATSLPGRTISRVERRAKRVLLIFEPAGVLVIHLGMSGRLTVIDQNQPIESHTHLTVRLQGFDDELRFRDPRRFGGVWFFDGDTPLAGDRLAAVGPEPLEVRLGDFRTLISRRRQLKAMLMDQAVIAGLGNIYCDESLHAAGLHPRRSGDSLNVDESKRLWQSIRAVLRRAIRFNGSTFMDYRDADGAEGKFQRLLKVYQREGEDCRRCGEPILRMVMNGRSTFYCKSCQPQSRKVRRAK